jgi:HAMP domain-containing protein
VSDLYDAADRFDAELMAGEALALARLRDVWVRALVQVEAEIDALGRDVRSRRRRSLPVDSKRWQAGRLAQIAEQVQAALLPPLTATATETGALQGSLITLAQEGTQEMVRVQVAEVGLTASFGQADLQAVRKAVGFFGDGSPLRETLTARAPDLAKGYEQLIADQLTLGWNPRKAARVARERLGADQGYAEKVLRTESVRAFRASSHATMQSFGEGVLLGWVWNAHLGDRRRRTCAACIALHGKLFPLGTPMGSHVLCRCAQVPAVAFSTSWGGVDGAQWLAGQPEDVQRAILGPAKLSAFQAGEFRLDELVGFQDDPKWGPVRFERSLKDIRENPGIVPGALPEEEREARRRAA